jgi:hypothetical protein
MNTIRDYKSRFNQLMESTMGNVRPLIMEQSGSTGNTQTTTGATSGSSLTYVSTAASFGGRDYYVYQNKVNNKFYMYVTNSADKKPNLMDDNGGKGYNTAKEAIDELKNTYPDEFDMGAGETGY